MKPKSKYEFAASFIMNEIRPRARRKHLSLEAFLPSSLLGLLIGAEYHGYLSRNMTRKFLDTLAHD